MEKARIWSIEGAPGRVRSKSHFYPIAALIAFLIFAIFFLFFKTMFWFLGALKEYWVFVVAGIIGLIVLRKLLMKKQLKVVQ